MIPNSLMIWNLFIDQQIGQLQDFIVVREAELFVPILYVLYGPRFNQRHHLLVLVHRKCLSIVVSILGLSRECEHEVQQCNSNGVELIKLAVLFVALIIVVLVATSPCLYGVLTLYGIEFLLW